MPLSVGDKIGHYEVISLLGQGGMGEVYRARDTKLKREVAVKVLPEAFARDPERMTRFQREAEVLASLNHPNIAAIHGVEDRALVMELVEGNSPKGPLPFDEAWKIASQIVAALEYAHEHSIMHRDLKPANIMITPEGVVKLLDFGLAKACSNQREPSASPENSPTLTLGATEVGVILGTAAYMAPEQARGKAVDKRTDIWSFGVVLYELLTGERLFTGEDAAETLAAVIHKQPDLAKVPRQARRLLEECLQKDPKQRLRDIGDAKRLLGVETPVEPAVATTPSQFRLGWLWPGVAALVTVALATLAFVHSREKPPADPERVRFPLLLPDKAAYGQTLSVSPDGRRVVFSATTEGGTRLWVRSLDSLDSRPLAGTENAYGSPFWSYDSRFIVFGLGGKVRKVDASGGPPQTLCDLPGTLRGGFWTRDDRIVFASDNSGLLQVAAAGGAASPVTEYDPASQGYHTYPALLPDERHFVYLRRGVADASGIYLGSLDRKPKEQSLKRLLADASTPAYVPSPGTGNGHILFVREGSLMAQPFDERRLEFAGDAVPIAEQISPQGQYAASSGALVYASGSAGQRHLAWYDRQGKPAGTIWNPGEYNELTLSPDGTQVALVAAPTGSGDIWTYEFVRGASTRVTLTFGVQPIWSPDGSRIMFRSLSSGNGLYVISASGAGNQELLLKTNFPATPKDWSRDGRFLLYEESNPKTRSDLWALPLQGERKPFVFLNSAFDERNGKFSPDGRFVTYLSNESGKDEVYVSSFPSSTGERWSISSGGGYQPRWRRDGKELLYLTADGKLMSVDVTLTPTFKAGPPKVLFQPPIYGGGTVNQTRWDIAPDGQKFIINTVTGEAASSLTVVLNWQAGLKK